MRKWLLLAGALAAVGILSRLPHPARDISKLEPVQAVHIYMEGSNVCIGTDTGASGSGRDLAAAVEDMRAGADGEIFLDTAQFLLLDPEFPVGEPLFEFLRPGCRVSLTDSAPDLPAAAGYFSVHRPHVTLAELRAYAAGEKRS